jgi:predicted hotdog family 3-hydroxylacyl-ACP dehydratase
VTIPRQDPGSFPPIGELLPHRRRAVLLSRVLSHDAATTTCEVDAGAGELYRDADGAVPAYVGLEFMAQAVAAHGGLLDREAGRPTRPGFFLGSRRLSFATARFEAGRPLVATATHLRGSGRMLAFDCSVRAAEGGDAMVSGILTVYLLESFEALVEDFTADD